MPSSAPVESPSKGEGADNGNKEPTAAATTTITHQSPLQAEDEALWEHERDLRDRVDRHLVQGNLSVKFLVNFYATIHIFAFHLLSLESVLSIALSVGMTIYAYRLGEDNSSFDGSIMDWVLLSFAVITPMSASIGMAFTRREQGTQHLGTFKTTLWNIYSAHLCWDWAKEGKPDSGRKASSMNWMEHSDAVLVEILALTSAVRRLLTLPLVSRARHRVTSAGQREARLVSALREKLHRNIYCHMGVLTKLCEDFKVAGLPPNEATRIRQWERFMTERIESLLMIKKYRTPQALRSFARLFTLLLPPFYAPYYGQMGRDLNSLSMGIAFSIFTAVALTALFESINQIEDPFTGGLSLDGIDLNDELGIVLQSQLLDLRLYHFPHAPQFSSRDLYLEEDQVRAT